MVVLRFNVWLPVKVISAHNSITFSSSTPDALIFLTTSAKSVSAVTVCIIVFAMARGAASASMQTAMPSAFQIFLFIAFSLSFGSLFSYMQPTK